MLIGLGINDDWSFERDFLKHKKVMIFAYDASVSRRHFLKQVLKSIVRIDNLKIFLRRLTTYINYIRFFSQPNIYHIQKYVGLNSQDPRHCTFMDVLSETESKDIFLKIDIEGSEYRFLQDLVSNAERISGMVLELHSVDLHLAEIEKFINNFKLNLVHVHANNYAPVRLDDELPTVLELTFSKYANVSEGRKLPHPLDMPNDKYYFEYEIVLDN